ncbi:MAG: family 16 glycoside hydrolase, partial [Planctomycetota bacterium]
LVSFALLGTEPPVVSRLQPSVEAVEERALTDATAGRVLLHDQFDREERDDSKEQVGGGWRTNSKSRAKGNKQVDLVERGDGGALHIVMHKEADHGVSVRHDVDAWTNGTLTLQFKLPPKGDIGIDLADLQEKSVHAGHLLIVRVKPTVTELRDHKAGGMELARRNRRKAGTVTEDDKRVMKATVKRIKRTVAVNEWHTLSMTTKDDVLSVQIDGESVGELKSPGIAHPTKRTIRIAVNSECWVDDLKLVAVE